jgi:hypothetical protein
MGNSDCFRGQQCTCGDGSSAQTERQVKWGRATALGDNSVPEGVDLQHELTERQVKLRTATALGDNSVPEGMALQHKLRDKSNGEQRLL